MLQYPSLLRSIDKEHNNVAGLNETANGVDGDEKASIGVKERIVYPKHGTEQCNRIGNRLKPFSGFLFVNLVESRPAAKIKKGRALLLYSVKYRWYRKEKKPQKIIKEE